MPVADFLDQAKKAKEQAAAKASELAERAAGLKDEATSKAAELSDHAVRMAADVRDAGLAKVAETIEAFNAALPVVKEAGYDVAEVDIAMGLPPRVIAVFTVSREISNDTFARLLAQHESRGFTVMLLKALHQAWKVQSRIGIVGMRPIGMAVDLGLTPAVTIKFR